MGDAMQARQHSDAENAKHNEVHAPELVVAEHYPADNVNPPDFTVDVMTQNASVHADRRSSASYGVRGTRPDRA